MAAETGRLPSPGRAPPDRPREEHGVAPSAEGRADGRRIARLMIGCRPEHRARVGVERDDACALRAVRPTDVGNDAAVFHQRRAGGAEKSLADAEPAHRIDVPDGFACRARRSRAAVLPPRTCRSVRSRRQGRRGALRRTRSRRGRRSCTRNARCSLPVRASNASTTSSEPRRWNRMTRSPTTTGPAKPSPTGFLPHLAGTRGRPRLRQRRSAVDAVSIRSEKLRPVGRRAVQGTMLDSQRGHECGCGDEYHRCLTHRAEDTTAYTVLMVKKAALFALAVAIGAAGCPRIGGRRIACDGSAWPRLFSSEANYDALEADRARQRQQTGPTQAGRTLSGPPSATGAADAGSERTRPTETDQPRPAAAGDGAGLETPGLPESGTPCLKWGAPYPVRRGRPGPISAGRTATAAMTRPAIRTDWPREGLTSDVEAADWAWLRVVCRSRWPRVHHRAAPRSGSCLRLRHRHRPRVVDPRLGRGVHRIPGRRRPARHADLPRGPPLCARRAGRASLPRRAEREPSSGAGTSSPTTAHESGMGHGGVSAHRRRQGHRAAGRPARQIGRRVQQAERRSASGRRSTISRPTRRRCSSRSPASGRSSSSARRARSVSPSTKAGCCGNIHG